MYAGMYSTGMKCDKGVAVAYVSQGVYCQDMPECNYTLGALRYEAANH